MVRLALLTSALAALSLVFANPTSFPIIGRAERGGCAAVAPQGFLDVAAEMAVSEAEESSKSAARKPKPQQRLQIQTWFHVIATSKAEADGWLSEKTLKAQLKVLNDNFAPHNIKFQLDGVTRSINATWARDGDELGMKAALRRGKYSALNVYFQPYLQYDAFGYCYYPERLPIGYDFSYDGCSIRADTVPGAALAYYNEGKTTTHEVGHWFGLAHTFEGGCAAPGDFIADTPAQFNASSGCPIGRDSCPTNAGLDPIHNYMDYSIDSCYQGFTPLQEVRMYNMFNTLRKVNDNQTESGVPRRH